MGNKRVLLTTSAAPQQSPFSTAEKRMPIGVGYLISVLRDAGNEVFFIDNYLEPSNFLETGFLVENKIDFIGIYANTICFRDTLRMLEKVEQLRRSGYWDGKIIVGGPHTTVALETIPDYVDFVVQGEGERAIIDIVEGRVTERVVRYSQIIYLDELPMPAWEVFAKMPYKWDMEWFEESPVFNMNTSRSCPFNCTFCSVRSIWGSKYTYFSAERVVEDVEHVIEKYGAKGIYFREDNFTLQKKRLTRFCELMIERNIKIPWACESRVSTIDEESIEMMAKAGLRGFYFGVESGSQRMLDLLHKDITVEQIRKAFSLCHKYNIKTAASMIVGIPGETEEDIRVTEELIKEIKPTTVWQNVFVGMPNSDLYKQVLRENLYEMIDDRGLVYLQGHNERTKRFYGSGPFSKKAAMPGNCQNLDMTDKPKISVLICVYNGQKFIRKTLESIYNQTFQDFELIVVDDTSTDDTPAILREMKDSRTFIYRNGQNLGPCKSANVGIGLCRGEYIIRSDADDISVPERFEKQLKVMQANPDCVAVGSWVQWIDENDNPKGTWKPVTQPDEIHRRLLIKNAIAHGSSIIRKEALLAINGYDESFKYSLDYDLWLRLSEIGKLMNIPELLYQLRAWDGSISVTKKDQQEKLAKQALANAFRRRGIRQPNQEDREGELVLSVVLTTYNRNDMLSRVLDGFANQNCDRQSYEVVVVDDGSNPKAQSVVEKFQSRMNTIYVYQDNSGLAASRNVGIKCSNGKIILFSDDDDIPDKNLVVEHIRSHQQNPDDSVAVLGHLQWHNDLKITTLMDYVTGVGGEYFGYLSMRHGQFYPVWKWWGGLISAKKNLLKSVDGPFDERLCFGYEDTELACRLLNKDVKILYNENAKSYILRGIDYKEFCERRYKQGRALYFVACKHPEIINNRYGLHNAEQIYSKDYQPNLEKWCNNICEFKDSLDALRNLIQPADRPVIEAVYTLYRESFKGFWLKGFIDQAHEIQQGKMTLNDPVNTQAPTLKIKASMTNIQNKPLSTKNKITFISYCMPICDVGSSNVRIYEILKLLVGRGYEIDYIYYSQTKADDRFVDTFDGKVNFKYVPFNINRILDCIINRNVNLPEALWITNLWTDDSIEFANKMADYFKAELPGTKIIIDTMDFHYKKHYRKFKCSGNEADKLTAQRFFDCERKLYPKADSVMVVSESERADIQSQINCTVDVIPNIHSLANYDKSINERRDICFIGGMGISHNRDAVKWFIQNIFPLILEKRPDVKFNLLGFGNEHFKSVLEKHPSIKVPGYVENAEEAISNYRVFVCPLTYGAGMKGKLGSAAVAGTAIVSTTVGVEGFDFVDGQNCFIADDPYQFADKCVRLLNDDQIWKNFSVNAQKMVYGNFSPEAVGSRIDGVLGRLLKAPIGIVGKVEKLKASIAISCSNSEKLIDECVRSGVM